MDHVEYYTWQKQKKLKHRKQVHEQECEKHLHCRKSENEFQVTNKKQISI